MASTNIPLKLIKLNIPQRRTNIPAPTVHETARLKKSGSTPSSKFVTKKVIDADGKVNNAIRHKGFKIPNLIFNLRFIIKTFKTDVTETQSPIPTTSALMPISAGKNQIETKRKTEPTR